MCPLDHGAGAAVDESGSRGKRQRQFVVSVGTVGLEHNGWGSYINVPAEEIPVVVRVSHDFVSKESGRSI